MLNIILITDKKAGHESISRGLIDYIQKKHDISVLEIYAQRRLKALMKIGIYLVNFFPLNKNFIIFLIRILYKKYDLDLNKKYEFIISTGGDTALLNVLLANFFDIPNFYCSSLRGLKSNLFTKIISIVDNKYENEILLDIAPINIEVGKKELDGNFLCILIGGPTKNYKFLDTEFVDIVQKLIIKAEKKQFKIFLTTSRRTPLSVEAKIKELVFSKKELFEKVVFYNEKPEKVIKYFFNNSDVIFCTEDSGSMITEAILSYKKTYTIHSSIKKLDNFYMKFILNLIKKGFIISLSSEDIDKITFTERFEKIDYKPVEKFYHEIKKILKL